VPKGTLLVDRPGATGPPRRSTGGRPASTSRSELEKVAFKLFAGRGFDDTSVEDIAAAAGIGRRTFFRYFQSKTDVVWGEFGVVLELMHDRLDAAPPDQPMMEAIRSAVIDFNVYPPAEEAWHRQRMSLILSVPALFANSTLHFTRWRAEIARFAASRLGTPQDDLVPVTFGYGALGASLAAYEQWLARPGTDLGRLLHRSFTELANGFRGGAE
jgi:mycofactocin system transcriptional regulator